MKLKKYLLLLSISLFGLLAHAQSKITIQGVVKDKTTGETLPQASIYIKELKTGSTTNSNGVYSMNLAPGKYTISVSFISYKTYETVAYIKTPGTINFELESDKLQLNEAVISAAKKNANVTRNEMSTEKLEMAKIRLIPALMGEVDLVKALLLLPGVQSTSEGSSGFSVRGGGPDQNLILLDDAIVYNASHLMGFFSVFNNDAVENIKLYKGDVPAAYGGRLSSLLEVTSHEPSNEKFGVTGGIGTISSRLMVEGPIAQGKSGFFLSGRRTYADLFLKLSSDEDVKNSKMYFYDLNGKINYTINKNNRIYLSGYVGSDLFGNKELTMDFGNLATTLRWNHLFSDKFFVNTSLTASNYNYDMKATTPSLSGRWKAGINGYGVRTDFSWLANANNTIRFGVSSTLHSFRPGNASAIVEDDSYHIDIPKSKAIESAIFLQNEQKIGKKLSLKYGLRASIFQNMGATKIFQNAYDENEKPIWKEYGKGDIFNHYWGIEPRIGAVYAFNESTSIKASYARTTQFLHLLSTGTAGSPLDVWIPANPNIKPQRAHQVALGLFRNFKNNMYETSVEGYYKDFSDVLDFKDHPEVFGNEVIEPELRTGKGKSYGAEFMVRKNEGRLTGWVSYTWSRAKRTVETINDNKEYSAPFDKPHNINVVVSYEISKRLSLGVNWVYSSGQPVTFPEGRYIFQGNSIPIYSGRNKYRMPDYHRMDASLTWDLNGKPRRWKNELNFSIYNLYGRKNPWMINFRKDEDGSQYAQMTYLFSFVPSVTYNFKF